MAASHAADMNLDFGKGSQVVAHLKLEIEVSMKLEHNSRCMCSFCITAHLT